MMHLHVNGVLHYDTQTANDFNFVNGWLNGYVPNRHIFESPRNSATDGY
jgi:hypothetical protein